MKLYAIYGVGKAMPPTLALVLLLLPLLLISVSHVGGVVLDDNNNNNNEQSQQDRLLKKNGGLLSNKPKMKIQDFDPPMVGEGRVDGSGGGGGTARAGGVFHKKKSGKKGKESDVPSSVPTMIPSRSMEPSTTELPSSSSPSMSAKKSNKKKKKKKEKKPKKPKKPKKGKKESEVPSSMPSPTQQTSTDVPSAAPSSSVVSEVPSFDPSSVPSSSSQPSMQPFAAVPSSSSQPSMQPSDVPSSSSQPSMQPSDVPSSSCQPSMQPSDVPSSSSQPSMQPSDVPSSSSQPSMQPSDVPSSSSEPSMQPTGTWCRRLTNFDDSSLYGHVDDPFLRQVSAEFSQQVVAPDVSICNLRESLYFQQMVSIKDCFDPVNRRKDVDVHKNEDDNDDDVNSYEPWIIPDLHSSSNNNNNMTVKLLAKNPGLWTIENFLTPDEVDRYIELMDKNGFEKGMYGSCNDPRKEYLTSQPSLNKVCFMIGETKQCEGPYQVSTCEHDVDPEDGLFVGTIQHRATNIMTVASKDVIGLGPKLTADPYMRTAVALGGTPPQLLHDDSHDVVSFLIYLTDGGAKTIFPEPNVEIEPKRGMAVTWINVGTDGYELQRSFHAVQAHIGPDPRMITRVSFPLELNTWTTTTSVNDESKKTVPSTAVDDVTHSDESLSSGEEHRTASTTARTSIE